MDEQLMALCRAEEIEIIAWTKKLVNMDSGSDDFEGLRAKQVVLTQMMEANGVAINAIEAPAPRQTTYNLVGTLNGRGKAKILFLNHYDTVWTKGEAAKRPFTIKDGIATGPGVADTLCNFAAINAMLRILKKLGEDNYGCLTFLFNCDEEYFSHCSKDLIVKTAEGQDVAYSLDGGGHDGELVIVSSRGTAFCDLEVTGIESHSGNAPEKGCNAGYEMAHQILSMRHLSDKEKGTDVNWTLGKFGMRSNIIPGNAWAQANIRVSTMAECQRVEDDMARHIGDEKNKLLPQSRLNMKFERCRPPFEDNPSTRMIFAKAAAIYKNELGRDLEGSKFGGGTDSSYSFQKTAALEGLGLGGSGYHSLDECLPLANIAPRLYLLTRLVIETIKGNIVPLGAGV